MAYILTEKLWYTADRKTAVSDGDPRAAFLIGPAGRELSDDEARRLGLKSKQPQENKKKQTPPNKGVSFPPAVKGSEGEPSAVDSLPHDFPAAALLRAAGLVTVTAVSTHPNLIQISGIGKATAARIREALRTP